MLMSSQFTLPVYKKLTKNCTISRENRGTSMTEHSTELEASVFVENSKHARITGDQNTNNSLRTYCVSLLSSSFLFLGHGSVVSNWSQIRRMHCRCSYWDTLNPPLSLLNKGGGPALLFWPKEGGFEPPPPFGPNFLFSQCTPKGLSRIMEAA